VKVDEFTVLGQPAASGSEAFESEKLPDGLASFNVATPGA